MSVFVFLLLTLGYCTDAQLHLLGSRQLTGMEQATEFTCIFKRTSAMDYSIKELIIKKGEDILAVVNENCNVQVFNEDVATAPKGKIDNKEGTSFLSITVKKKDEDPNNRYTCFAVAVDKSGTKNNLTASVTPQKPTPVNNAESSQLTPTVSIVNQGCDCKQINTLSQSLNQNQTKLTNEFNKLQATLSDKLNKLQESERKILQELANQRKLQTVLTEQVGDVEKIRLRIEADQVTCGKEVGGFPKKENGLDTVEIPVKFPTPFSSPPKLFYSVRHFAIQSNRTIQFLIKHAEITKDGFTMICSTWGDTIVAKLAIRWMAFGK